MKKMLVSSFSVLLVLLVPLSAMAKDLTIAFCFQDLETEFWLPGIKRSPKRCAVRAST